MPRKVDYASRFHFFREAAFAIVRDRGVAALSRRALADELGTSRNRVDDVLRAQSDLRVLAAGEVKNRRTTGRFHLMEGRPEEVAGKLVTSLMPDTPGRIDEELVWLRLILEGPRATTSPDEDPDGPDPCGCGTRSHSGAMCTPSQPAKHPSEREPMPRSIIRSIVGSILWPGTEPSASKS
jgi:hypothetical protein